jgi:hypothetical protein
MSPFCFVCHYYSKLGNIGQSEKSSTKVCNTQVLLFSIQELLLELG